jgi:hypothetical protein
MTMIAVSRMLRKLSSSLICICLVVHAGIGSVAHAGLQVTPIGKTYTPHADRTVIQTTRSDPGGSTSIRNVDGPHLRWKSQGYFQRNRDLGQVFTPSQDFRLDAIVLRTGPSDNAVKAGAPGAEVFLQFFEVTGEPRINDSGTGPGEDARHGFSENHRCDDYIEGVKYRSMHIVRSGIFPGLPPTADRSGNPTGDSTGKFHYLRLDLTGADELAFKAGKRYAFMLGFIEPAPERAFTLGNHNAAGVNAAPSMTDAHDFYHGGWALRREGDGKIPPMMTGGPELPADARLRKRLISESLFYPQPARFQLSPTTDGYPDVDTYRDLEFYIEAKRPAGNNASNLLCRVDFETGDLSQAHSVHKDRAAAVEVVKNPSGTGLVIKSSISPTEERAEIRVHRDPVPSERWYGWSLYLPPEYQEVKGKSDILFQWHRGGGAPSWAKGHPMCFMINAQGNYQLIWTFQKSPDNSESRVNESQDLGLNYLSDRGKWVHWALHAKWSIANEGYLGVYRNGKLVWERRGPNWLNWGYGPMVKAGIYTGDPGWSGNNPTVVYHDNIFVGDENSSLHQVCPALFAGR